MNARELKKRTEEICNRQSAFFATGNTLSYDFRRRQLRALKKSLKLNEKRLEKALAADLGKPVMESYLGEIGFVYEEIGFILKNLKEWMEPEAVPTPVSIPFSDSRIVREPFGRVLIIGPWNYPLMLLISPLAGSIAAGNCSLLKPSELTPATAELITEIIRNEFPPDYISVMNGGAEVSKALLACRFDFIFFTGSTTVGKIVAKAAANFLTPAVLELGGKSPCVVHEDANIPVSARRIVFGKFFNAGQSCVAPDYLIVHEKIRDRLVAELQSVIASGFGADASASPDYARIVNKGHFERILRLMQKGKILSGGAHDPDRLYIEPTLLEPSSLRDPVMKEEIFGPVLPIVTYRSLDEVQSIIRENPDPLAFYVFTGSGKISETLLRNVAFGGGCVNNTMVHLANSHLPFGGVRGSGAGNYHGRFSFEAFSHKKGVIRSSFRPDIGLQYQPYGKRDKLIRRIIR